MTYPVSVCSFKPFVPVIDLAFVTAALTHTARHLLSRAIGDGTTLTPVYAQVGSGSDLQRWGASPRPSPDTTECTTFEAYATVTVEVANDKSFALVATLAVTPAYFVREILVFAAITNSPIVAENGTAIPFAVAVVPDLLHTVGQQFALRLVVPV